MPSSTGLSAMIRDALAQGLRAGRANLIPGIVLWLCGTLIIVSYYYVPAARNSWEMVADAKEKYGFLFSACSTALFGGIIPYIFQWIAPSTRAGLRWSHVGFFIVFWAVKGMEIDLFYRVQAWLWGDDNQLSTILIKVFVDQIVYVPIWVVPTMTLAYVFKDAGFRLSGLREKLGPTPYLTWCLPITLTNWIVWIPAVSLIYCLPLALQLPVQNLVLCLYVLIILFLTKK